MVPSLDVVLGLGSNVGSREALLRAAIDLLAATGGLEVVSRSPIFESAPVGPPQPRYLNAAVRVRSTLDATALLRAMHAVETSLGRARRERWGPRTLDLDGLWIRDVALSTPPFVVPHPELLAREFALRPLLALVDDAVDPRDGAPLARTLSTLARDETLVERPFEARFVRRELLHTADEGFVTRALDRADLLAAATEAMGSLIVDAETVSARRAVPLAIELDEDAGDDERMFAWLSEALYHLDAGRLALRRAVVFEDGPRGVKGALFGEDLDEARHGVRSALKAVTWHALEVGETGDGGWEAQVVIDV